MRRQLVNGLFADLLQVVGFLRVYVVHNFNAARANFEAKQFTTGDFDLPSDISSCKKVL